jgi:hypothetical protein
MALDSQATAFLVRAQEATRLMRAGGRILAITYAPSARTGSWQQWIGMGSAKTALEALVRCFAVALVSQGITVNAVSPGLTKDRVLNGLPREVQSVSHAWHESGWTPMGTPAGIGNTVALLCSTQAAWITGQTIYAHGGASLMDTSYRELLRRNSWGSIDAASLYGEVAGEGVAGSRPLNLLAQRLCSRRHVRIRVPGELVYELHWNRGWVNTRDVR